MFLKRMETGSLSVRSVWALLKKRGRCALFTSFSPVVMFVLFLLLLCGENPGDVMPVYHGDTTRSAGR